MWKQQIKNKQKKKNMHTRSMIPNTSSRTTYFSSVSVLLVCRACARALAPSAPMFLLYNLCVVATNQTTSKIKRRQKQKDNAQSAQSSEQMIPPNPLNRPLTPAWSACCLSAGPVKGHGLRNRRCSCVQSCVWNKKNMQTYEKDRCTR